MLVGSWCSDLRSFPNWLWLAGVLVLPQLPFWLAGIFMPLQRPVFNLDLLLGAVLLCWSWRLGLPVLLLLFGLDLLRSAALIYHFATPAEMLSALRFSGLVDAGQILSWPLVAAFAGLVVSLGLLVVLARKLRGSLASLLMIAPLLWAVDALNGSSQIFGLGADRARSSVNVVGSAGWNIYSSWRVVQGLKSRPMQPLPDPKAYRVIDRWMQDNPGQSVLIVIVESLGRPSAPAVNDWLRKQLLTERVLDRWRVEETDEDFFGSTTRGELRTLCAINGHYSRLTSEDATRCLPQLARARGDDVRGLHGFTLTMFDRADWWPRIGLTPWRFGSEAARGCNLAFSGVCDSAVLQQALTLVDAPRQFVYALTLDTHLPLADRGPSAPLALLRHCQSEQLPATACELVARFGHLLNEVELGLSALRQPPLVVLVGDHAPPFISVDSRNAFDASKVPLFVLRPR